MKNNILRKRAIPLTFAFLFLVSLFLPYDHTMDNPWGIQNTGWIVNFAYLFGAGNGPTPRASWYFQAIAFILFVAIAFVFLIFRKWSKKIGYPLAILAAVTWAFLATPYFRPILFKTGFDINMLSFYQRSMALGYYLSIILALFLVAWMFWTVSKNQKA